MAINLIASVIIPLLLTNLVAGSDVIDYSELSADSFKSEIDQLDLALVKFFAPWCGHCKRLAPEFETAAKKLAADDPPVPLIKVDCTNEKGGKDICNKHEVQAYPTLKIFRNSQSSEFDGGRDADSIVKKMRSLSGPPSKELQSFEKVDKLYKESKNLLVIGLFKNSDDSLYKTFNENANQNRELATYVHIFEEKASDKVDKLANLGSKKDVTVPAIVLARPVIYRSKFEPDYVIYDSVDDLKTWIEENTHGLVVALSSTDRSLPKPTIMIYYNVDYERDPKGTNYWRNRVLKVASKYKDEKLTFAISSINQHASELSDFGIDMARLSKENSPAVVAKDQDGKKYAMQEKFSVESLVKFVESLLAGKLEPFMKSEEEPDNTDAGVKIAVAKNFESLVTKSEKDIFIEFYAPWCGHCKALAPAWEELGNKLKDEPGVDIVKIDATANDIPDTFTVHGFPTIYWYPKDTKSPVKYEGARDVEALFRYVASQVTDDLQGFDRDGNARDAKDEL